MKRKKGFTLIELIAVLVILAILALIVTPLVMNIIRKARISADKRSIDAYGRSIELAIATYLLDNGDFPTSIDELTIEYSGDKVECERAQLNSDSTVYLAGCRVAGRNVEYTYGSEGAAPTYTAYSVGDEVTYNNVDYYVIENSDINKETVSLLKKEPITSSEISLYLSSSEVANKVNISYTYAQMAYYSAENCISAGDISGCNTNYAVSDIKQVIDIWAANYTHLSDLVLDKTGYSARLITYEELTDNLGYEKIAGGTILPNTNGSTPNWVYSNYWYWTMSQYNDSVLEVWMVCDYGGIDKHYIGDNMREIRPVITIKKSALEN